MLKRLLYWFFPYRLNTQKKPWEKKPLNHYQSEFPMARAFTTDLPLSRGNVNFYNPGIGGNHRSVLWVAASAIYGWVRKNRPDKNKANQLRVVLIGENFKTAFVALSQFDLLSRDLWLPLNIEDDVMCAGKLKENRVTYNAEHSHHEVFMSSLKRYCTPQYEGQEPYDIVVICADIREKEDTKENYRYFNSSAGTIYRVEDGFWKEVAEMVKGTGVTVLTCSSKPSYVPYSFLPDDQSGFRVIRPSLYD